AIEINDTSDKTINTELEKGYITNSIHTNYSNNKINTNALKYVSNNSKYLKSSNEEINTITSSSYSGNTVYVSTNGSDSNDGSQFRPLKTLDYTFNKAFNKTSNYNNIYLYAGNYYYNSSCSVTKNMNIIGEGKSSIITLKNTTLFTIGTSNINLNLSHMTVKNGVGTYGSVIKINDKGSFSSLTLDDVFLTDNQGTIGGTVGCTANECNITIKNSEFSRNNATKLGGVFSFSGSNDNINIINSTFSNNYVNTVSTDSNTGCGGVIYVGGNSKLNVYNSTFRKNRAFNGGAIYNANNATSTIISSYFNYNLAKCGLIWGYGGCIMVGNGLTFVKNSSFNDSHASRGGAIGINSGKNVTINDSVCAYNTASVYGGAIFSFSKYLKINNVNFTKNSADVRGGAIMDLGQGDSLIITNTNFISNKALNYSDINGSITFGGALAGNANSGNYSLTNVLFYNNTANRGGAISSVSLILVWNLNNVTFLNNSANSVNSAFGGAIYIKSDGTTFTLTSNVFNNNKAISTTESYGGAIMSICNNNITNIVVIKDSSFNNNSAGKGGSIAMLNRGVLSISFTNVINNKAIYDDGKGGAIYSKDIIIITECAFINNTSNGYGGAIYAISNCSTIGSSFYNNFANRNNFNSGNNIYSSNICGIANYNWWGTNNYELIQKSNYNVNSDCPIVFTASIMEYNYNSKLNITTCKILLDLYHYNDSGEFKLLTQELVAKTVIFNKNLDSIIIAGDPSRREITYNCSGDFIKLGVTATVDGETINLTTTKHPTYLKFNKLEQKGNNLTINSVFKDICTEGNLKGNVNVTIKVNGNIVPGYVNKTITGGVLNCNIVNGNSNITNITIICSGNENYSSCNIYREFIITKSDKNLNKINKLINIPEDIFNLSDEEIDEGLLIENEKLLINTIENGTYNEYKKIYDNINSYIYAINSNEACLIKEIN
ncbi:MAG: hypothetical protein Q4Q23_07975, partial [Methanobacteriaceae archaeon]|nr:hypothetical protein [Methanobacteriaceae archaeon]